MQRYGRFNRPGLRGSANYALLGGTEGAAPSPPPSPSWTLDFSSGEPWANGTNYTFSSTASTTRTFVNSSGYVAPCVANLLLRSEDFTTTWTNTNTTEPTTNNTAPNGAATADEIKEAAATSASYSIQQSVSVTTGVTYTFTIYAKAGTATVLQLTAGSTQFGVNEWANFDLSTGVVGSVGTSVTGSDATIENIGSGWYRCKLTMDCTATGTSTAIAAFTNNSTTAGRLTTYTVTAGNEKSLYLWGAQLVTGSAALPYSATTTSTNGIPRLTHDKNGSRLGLLVEPAATNLVLQSQQFNTGWFAARMTVTADSVSAPDNTTSADTITEDTTSNTHGRWQSVSVTSGASYTLSCYIKKGTRRYVCIGFWDSTTSNSGAQFDLDNITATAVWGTGYSASSNAKITDAGNGWYRCSVTCVAKSTTDYPAVTHRSTASTAGSGGSIVESYTGSTANYTYVWGFQMEAGSAETSYIPTTTATVTRSADIAYVETADVTNWGRPGSFVVEYYKPLEQSGGVVVADDDDAGNAGRLGVEYSAGGPRIVYGTSGSGSGGTDNAGLNKIGWAWDGSGAATRSALNGSALDTSLATSFDPTATDGINLGGNIDWTSLPLTVSGQPNVIIRKVQFWNSQLSAADLNTLTT